MFVFSEGFSELLNEFSLVSLSITNNGLENFTIGGIIIKIPQHHELCNKNAIIQTTYNQNHGFVRDNINQLLIPLVLVYEIPDLLEYYMVNNGFFTELYDVYGRPVAYVRLLNFNTDYQFDESCRIDINFRLDKVGVYDV